MISKNYTELSLILCALLIVGIIVSISHCYRQSLVSSV